MRWREERDKWMVTMSGRRVSKKGRVMERNEEREG